MQDRFFPWWVSALKRGITAGWLPFSLGEAPWHRGFRASWPGGVPRTFMQKVQFKLIHDRRAIGRVYSGKLAVRDYVHAIVPSLRLPRLLGVFARTSDVLAAVPPGAWVMKASHGSGMVLIATPEKTPSPTEIRRCADRWLATDYAVHCWERHYLRLPRRVMFEEYLGTAAHPPADYKFYVIHRRVRLVTVDEGRFGSHTRNLFYPDWTPIGSRIGSAPPASPPPAAPPQLAQMLSLAEALSRDTDMLRVDLYVVRGEIYFGELTHAPWGGHSNWEDPALDLEMGGYWTLPARYEDEG